MAYEHITDEELDDIFKDLDFNQLRELGYYSIDEISDQEELEDFLEAIEEDFSGLSRQEKIEELGGQVIEAYRDYKDSTAWEVDLDAESKKKKLTQKQKYEKLIAKAIHDVDDMRDLYAEWGGMNLAMSLDEMEELIKGRRVKNAETFEADSPFNTMLLIRDEIIIDQEDNFEYLLSIYMELENDLRELDESESQKHPFYEEMRRYRLQIADRLDDLQQEVEVKPSIEMDAEGFLLEKPASTGFLFGLGVMGSTLVATLAMGLIAAWFVNEE